MSTAEKELYAPSRLALALPEIRIANAQLNAYVTAMEIEALFDTHFIIIELCGPFGRVMPA